MRLSIRSINVADSTLLSDTFEMHVILSDGTDKLTAFGSRLSATGTMWLCIFNRNVIVGVNVVTKQIEHEFFNVGCPNDICLSPEDSDILFVAGGASIRSPHNLTKSSDETLAVLPPVGRIYSIDVKQKKVETFHSEDLHSLAGIEGMNGQVFISQLYEVLTISSKQKSKAESIWQGTEVGSGKDCFFSDNLSIWDERTVASSIYRQIDARSAATMKESFVSSVGWSIGKIVTSVANLFTGAPNALDNAELLLDFSEQDAFEDVHFFLFDSLDVTKRWHFKMDNKSLNMPPGCTFDGHVTHVARHGGKVIFVNFKSNYVMLLEETAVLSALDAARANETCNNVGI